MPRFGMCMLLVLLAVVAGCPLGALAQESPEVPPAVGTIEVALRVEPSGGPVAPDGSRSTARLFADVRCAVAVVQAEPIPIALALTAPGAASNVALEPAVLEFAWQHPACPQGSSTTLAAVVSFAMSPTQAFGTVVPWHVEASSEHMEGTAVAQWEETVGFHGTVEARIKPVVHANATERVHIPVHLDSRANAAVPYSMELVDVFDAEIQVEMPAPGIVPSGVSGGQERSVVDVGLVSAHEGQGAIRVRVLFGDPTGSHEPWREQVVSATVFVSEPGLRTASGQSADSPSTGWVWLTVALVVAALARRHRA